MTPGVWAPRALLLGAWTLASACTLDDGRGFARISGTLGGHFAAREAESQRITPDGWIALADGFEIELPRLSLSVHGVVFSQLDDGSPAPSAADEHAHSHDHGGGEPESAAGGDASPTDLLEIFVEAAVDLLDQPPAPLGSNGCPASGCELGFGRIDRVTVELEHLSANVRLRDASADDRLDGNTLSVELELPLADLEVSATVDPPATLDHESPDALHLALDLVVAAELFDGVAWTDLERRGPVARIDDTSNPAARAAIVEELRHSRLELEMSHDEAER